MSDSIVPIFICVLLPVAIVFLVLLFKDKNQKERFEVISKAMQLRWKRCRFRRGRGSLCIWKLWLRPE